MRRGPIFHILLRLPWAAALGLALAGAAFTAYMALMAARDGLPAGAPPLGNLLGVARSYLFRHALRNTLLMSGLIAPAVGVIAWATLRSPSAHAPGWTAWPAWQALAAAPLFLPVPVAALLWQPLFARIDLVAHTDGALLFIAAASLWRLWPLSLLARPWATARGAGRVAVMVALLALWAALIDAGTLLLLSGGQPFNATHNWVSWAWQTLWVSRLWGDAAVMLGGLAFVTALIAGAMLFLSQRTPSPQPSVAPDRVRLRSGYVAPIGALLALAPLMLHAPHLRLLTAGSALADAARAGYVAWLANTVLTWLLAWLLAATIAASAARVGARRGSVGAWLSLVAGTAVVPLWPLIAGRLAAPLALLDSRLFLVCAAGITAGLIAPAFVDGARTPWRATGLLTALLVLGQFSTEIVLGGPLHAASLGAGLALALGAHPGLVEARAWALLLTFVLACLAAYVALECCAVYDRMRSH